MVFYPVQNQCRAQPFLLGNEHITINLVVSYVAISRVFLRGVVCGKRGNLTSTHLKPEQSLWMQDRKSRRASGPTQGRRVPRSPNSLNLRDVLTLPARAQTMTNLCLLEIPRRA